MEGRKGEKSREVVVYDLDRRVVQMCGRRHAGTDILGDYACEIAGEMTIDNVVAHPGESLGVAADRVPAGREIPRVKNGDPRTSSAPPRSLWAHSPKLSPISWHLPFARPSSKYLLHLLRLSR